MYQGNGRQADENITELLPELDVVPPLAFVIKTVDARDGGTLMVAPEQKHILGVLHFVREKEGNSLNGLLASIHIVAEGEVVRVGWEPSKFEVPQEIMVLTVQVTEDPNWRLEFEERGLAEQRVAGHAQQSLELALVQLHMGPCCPLHAWCQNAYQSVHFQRHDRWLRWLHGGRGSADGQGHRHIVQSYLECRQAPGHGVRAHVSASKTLHILAQNTRIGEHPAVVHVRSLEINDHHVSVGCLVCEAGELHEGARCARFPPSHIVGEPPEVGSRKCGLEVEGYHVIAFDHGHGKERHALPNRPESAEALGQEARHRTDLAERQQRVNHTFVVASVVLEMFRHCWEPIAQGVSCHTCLALRKRSGSELHFHSV
mmetsp:Transcript_3987/g.11124  ORF Transcript_3987/g.11124 Transcript_3987/m.11124 type:complete len:372 (+) Transcript_3987:590-1705(+)